jgi:DNA primase
VSAPTRSPIVEARARHSLAEVAARTGIELAATTGNLSVRCPLPSHGHPDRTPSMRLYLDDDRYYCFGCGAKGDAIQWVRDAIGCGIAEAIRALESGEAFPNAWAGRPFDRGGPSSRAPQPGALGELPDRSRTPAGVVTELVRLAWARCMTASLHRLGAAYLANRGIEVGVLEAFTGRAEVGHTPDSTGGIVAPLLGDGFGEDALVDAGLATRRGDGCLVDFYHHRVLVPLYEGETLVGLIGRNVGSPRAPKYKNPPRTLLYDKSVTLYQPLPAPSPEGLVLVVEGTLDAMAIAVAALRAGQADRYCPLTQSGRELSARQLERVLGLPGRVVLGFDGDEAGRDATRRVAAAAARRGRAVLVASLPEGEDPASWLAGQGEAGLAVWRPSCRDTRAVGESQTPSGERRVPGRQPEPMPTSGWEVSL